MSAFVAHFVGDYICMFCTYKLRNTTVRETLQAFRKKNDELQLIPIFEQEKNKTEKN